VSDLAHPATAMATRSSFTTGAIKLAVVVVSLLTIGLSILSRPDWKLRNFDQVFYVTIAYDLDRYGIFSDGIFDPVDSSVQPAKPGMFFGPVFPVIVRVGAYRLTRPSLYELKNDPFNLRNYITSCQAGDATLKA
jgi:hypothetical protein